MLQISDLDIGFQAGRCYEHEIPAEVNPRKEETVGEIFDRPDGRNNAAPLWIILLLLTLLPRSDYCNL